MAGFKAGQVIPAHPLALNAQRRLDERRQRALTRYYIDAGSGGIAVGVHTTQFEIRDHGIYEPVLTLAADEVDSWGQAGLIKIAGLAGLTRQAVAEAQCAVGLGYHAGLLSLAALPDATDDDLIAHCRTVSAEIPLIGFYLQPAVGGRILSVDFWRRFAELDNVIAIKIAPFNRYRTLDVIKGVLRARAQDRVVLYTGNDDHIIPDLVTPYRLAIDGETVTVRIRGGLLGQWSVWTSKAVQLLERIHQNVDAGDVDPELLALDSQLTDCNSAIFDADNGFQGVIAGCHEVLRRQGLLQGIWCLDKSESLGPGQAQEIDRVYAAYPQMNDDQFVKDNIERWLG